MLSVGLVDNLELLLGEFIGLAIRNKIGIKQIQIQRETERDCRLSGSLSVDVMYHSLAFGSRARCCILEKSTA